MATPFQGVPHAPVRLTFARSMMLGNLLPAVGGRLERSFPRRSDERTLGEARSMKKVLFLCTGNYYRSRFAEIFFNWHAARQALAWSAESRGLALHASNVGPISRHALAYLTTRGILSDSCSRFPIAVSEADFAVAHRIIAVKEAEHRPLVEANFAKGRDRVEYWHVHDVDCALPAESIPHLEREVARLLEQLAKQAA
jgi:protein-tyrosine phosphatase